MVQPQESQENRPTQLQYQRRDGSGGAARAVVHTGSARQSARSGRSAWFCVCKLTVDDVADKNFYLYGARKVPIVFLRSVAQ
jgi:hypothetical protein